MIGLGRITAIDKNLSILNHINVLQLEARRQEKNFQLRGMALHGRMNAMPMKNGIHSGKDPDLMGKARGEFLAGYEKKLIQAERSWRHTKHI